MKEEGKTKHLENGKEKQVETKKEEKQRKSML
jgi:hypothetical protein